MANKATKIRTALAQVPVQCKNQTHSLDIASIDRKSFQLALPNVRSSPNGVGRRVICHHEYISLPHPLLRIRFGIRQSAAGNRLVSRGAELIFRKGIYCRRLLFTTFSNAARKVRTVRKRRGSISMTQENPA